MVPFRLRLDAERFKQGNCVFVPSYCVCYSFLDGARTVVFHRYTVGRRIPFLSVIRR
jgi:hypothetical protein